MAGKPEGGGLKFREDDEKSRAGEEAKRAVKEKELKIVVGILGDDPKELSFKPGTTYGEVVSQLNWPGNAEIRVNDTDVNLKAPIKENDVLVAFPASITGGLGQRTKKAKARTAKRKAVKIKLRSRKPVKRTAKAQARVQPKVGRSTSVERREAIQRRGDDPTRSATLPIKEGAMTPKGPFVAGPAMTATFPDMQLEPKSS